MDLVPLVLFLYSKYSNMCTHPLTVYKFTFASLRKKKKQKFTFADKKNKFRKIPPHYLWLI